MPDNPENTPALTDRIVDLETHIALLQRDLELLNQVVLDQQTQIQLLKQRLDHWESHLTGQEDDEEGPPHLEKPPHY